MGSNNAKKDNNNNNSGTSSDADNVDKGGVGRLTFLENKVEELQRLVKERNLEVARLKDQSVTSSSALLSSVPPTSGGSKRGYLFKWQDRTLGWGGTKWALRFVQLNERGRLSYFRTHNDLAPRYVLTLKQCGIRDEGFKVNGQSNYFYVFSVYQRSADEGGVNGQNASGLDSEDDDEEEEDYDEEEDYVPLLRFSTQSLAEKQQWIKVLRESIKLCDSPDFSKLGSGESEEKAALAETLRKYGQYPIALNEVGTLPPIYFGLPALPKPKRFPSFSRLRTTTSGESLSKMQHKERNDYPPSKPMHREAAPSYLSEDAPDQNYRGLLNLALIILVASNFRILYDNIRSEGFVLWKLQEDLLRDVRSEWISGGLLLMVAHLPFFSGMASLPAFVLVAYVLEYLVSRRYLSNGTALFLHLVNALSSFLVPTWITWYSLAARPIYGIILLMHATITAMKLWSYAHANSDYRAKSKTPQQHAVTQQQLALIKDVDDDSDAVQYPENVTISNLLYFWFAPTLTYQIAFPRAPKFRPVRFISIVLRLILAMGLLTFIFAQVVTPALNDLLHDLDERAAAKAGKEESWWDEQLFTAGIFAEYILRLAIANTYGWLTVFYAYFHLYLNLFAEILRFGDRVFYKDWWNSSNVSAYWRLWNMPVHYWLVRHLYFPCIRLKWSRTMATFVVFFFSAVMHEALISIPFHMIRPWSFLAMMGQLPLVIVTKYFDKKAPGSSVGNVIFWMSFCMVGQPMAFLLYTIDYRKYRSGSDSASLESTNSLFGFGGGAHSEL